MLRSIMTINRSDLKDFRVINIKFMMFIMSVSISFFAFAEDLIVFRNGDVVKAIVLEILKTEVKYRRASNPQGPIYTVDKTDLLFINYENGDKDTFSHLQDTGNNIASLSQDNVSPKEILPIPDTDNDRLISRINNCTVLHGKRKPDESKLRTTKERTWIMGITSGSILSDKNISVEFIHSYDYQYIKNGKTESWWTDDSKHFKGKYKIFITNKTSHPIYIDMSNSFRIWPGGKSEPFYSNVSITNTSGRQNSGSLGLGAVTNALGIGGPVGKLAQGIGVEKSSINSTSVTVAENNIVIIPPGGEILMPPKKEVLSDGILIQYEDINPLGVQEELYQKLTVDNTNKIEKNRYVAFPSDEISEGMSYYITYSTTPDFATYTSLPFGFYVRGVFGSEGHYDEFTSDDGKVIIGTGI